MLKNVIAVKLAQLYVNATHVLLVFTWALPSSCQVYKVIVNVGQQEWFVFRRYAEFDKLYNTVSDGTLSF